VILILCLSFTGPSFAQNNAQAMRFLTVNALMQYGQRLYDRGDFDEATAVFDHVLTYDGHQVQALQYLKEMGKGPVYNVERNSPLVKQGRVPFNEKNNIVVNRTEGSKSVGRDELAGRPNIIKKQEEVDFNTVDISDTDSIKKAIEAQKLIVEKLRAQVKELRAKQEALNAKE